MERRPIFSRAAKVIGVVLTILAASCRDPLGFLANLAQASGYDAKSLLAPTAPTEASTAPGQGAVQTESTDGRRDRQVEPDTFDASGGSSDPPPTNEHLRHLPSVSDPDPRPKTDTPRDPAGAAWEPEALAVASCVEGGVVELSVVSGADRTDPRAQISQVARNDIAEGVEFPEVTALSIPGPWRLVPVSIDVGTSTVELVFSSSDSIHPGLRDNWFNGYRLDFVLPDGIALAAARVSPSGDVPRANLAVDVVSNTLFVNVAGLKTRPRMHALIELECSRRPPRSSASLSGY